MSLCALEKQRAEASRVRDLLLDTITLLIKNGTSEFINNITIEGVIGVTVDKGYDTERVYVAHIDKVEKSDAALAEEAAALAIEQQNNSSNRKRKSPDPEDGVPNKISRLKDAGRNIKEDIQDTACQTVAESNSIKLENSCTAEPGAQHTMTPEGEVVFGDLHFTVSAHGTWQFYHRDLPGFIYKRQSASATSNRWRCSRHGKPVSCLATARTNLVHGFGPMGPGPLVSFTGEHNHPPVGVDAAAPPLPPPPAPKEHTVSLDGLTDGHFSYGADYS